MCKRHEDDEALADALFDEMADELADEPEADEIIDAEPDHGDLVEQEDFEQADEYFQSDTFHEPDYDFHADYATADYGGEG